MGFLIQRGKESLECSGSRLTVGSHATSDLVLDDPVAARLHVILSLGPRGVAAEPQLTATGSFLDGDLIAEPVPFPVGSELVLGTSRIVLESYDAATSVAAIALSERSFFHVQKKRGVFQSDADEAVRSEVRFGRFSSLRGLNALVLLGLLAVVLGWGLGALEKWEGPGRVWASPGVLAGAHLAGFAPDLGALPPSGWSTAQLDHAAENGCAACHVGEAGDYAGEVSCSGCHDDMLRDLGPRGRHPFKSAFEMDCQACHRIHGEGASLRGIHFHGQDCAECHEQSPAELDQLLAGVEGPLMAAPKPRSVGNAGFRHQDHASEDAANCTSCHKSDAEGRHYSLAGGAELCFGCHGDEVRLAEELAKRGSRGAAPVPIRLTLEEHGRAGELCTDCHDSVQDIAPPEATLVPAGGLAALEFKVDRHHAGGDVECSQCHLKPLREKPTDRSPRFDHGLHGGIQCDSCHFRSGLPSELAPESWDEADLLASCIDCHQDGGGVLAVRFAAQGTPVRDAASAGQARFAHDQHVAIGHACADCHVVPDGDDAGQVVRSARSCASCHYDRRAQRHTIPARVEECSRCHPSSGENHPAGAHSLADLFAEPSDAPAAPSAARAGSLFDHSIGGHSKVSCAQCHGWSGAGIEATALPTAQKDTCRGCHQNNRFHWR
jgi:hypothetical protein